MNEHIEYDIQYYDEQTMSWLPFRHRYTTLEEAKKGLAEYNYVYTREKHRIIMRTVTDWCEVKEGAME